ncbi:MAG: hypothetical protein AB7N80_10300 [Bdellovibrionales bacterium]
MSGKGIGEGLIGFGLITFCLSFGSGAQAAGYQEFWMSTDGQVTSAASAQTLRQQTEALSLYFSKAADVFGVAELEGHELIVYVPIAVLNREQSPVMSKLVRDIRYHAVTKQILANGGQLLHFRPRDAAHAAVSLHEAALMLANVPDKELRPMLHKGQYIGHGFVFKTCEALLDKAVDWYLSIRI